MRILSFIATICITLPLTLFALSFALSNGAPVTVALWPFEPAAPAAFKLGVLGVAMLGLGFFAGAVFVGLFSQGYRLNAWREKRRADRLEKDLRAAEEKLAALPVAVAVESAASVPPVLPRAIGEF